MIISIYFITIKNVRILMERRRKKERESFLLLFPDAPYMVLGTSLVCVCSLCGRIRKTYLGE